MNEIIIKIAPVLLIFLLGIILRRANALPPDSSDSLLKFVFHVSFPASILLSISKMELTLELAFLPIIAIVIIFASYFVARMVSGAFRLPRPTLGVFLVGSMIINTGFTYPFFIAAFGQEGFARASLFDFGNGLVVLTFVYYIAVKYGSNQVSTGMAKKFFSSTPLWALLIALIFNFSNITFPSLIVELLQLLSNTLIPLFMISLGISFTLKIINFKALFSVITIRMFFGLLLGFIFVHIFGLNGLSRIVVLISSAAPVGFSTLTFSTMENLDKEFAASVVSVSILIGIVFTTMLLLTV